MRYRHWPAAKRRMARIPYTRRQRSAVLQRALDDAADERLITANPVRRVKRPRQVKPEHVLWSDDEAARFEAAAAAHRLAPIITLQCLGLRPEEVCGLRWAHIDLDARTLRIRSVRTLVDGSPVVKAPKTAAGKRTPPLDDALAVMPAGWHARQAAEKLAAGPAWQGSGDVLADELGLPSDLARLRRVWFKLNRRPLRPEQGAQRYEMPAWGVCAGQRRPLGSGDRA